MKSMVMSFGQAASHSRWLVQEPKNASICSTMARVRRGRSGWPWGSRFRCASLAAVKSWPAPLGQAATQAPQPMQAAASIARSEASLGTAIRFASGALPVGAVMKPPASMMRSKAPRSTTRSLTSGKPAERKGSTVIVSPSVKRAQVQLAGRGAVLGAVGLAVDRQPARAADPLAAVGVERDGLAALAGQVLVQEVEQLEERHLVGRVVDLVGLELAGARRARLAPDAQREPQA